MDCDEAAFVLKPWQVKDVVEKQIDEEDICNCNKIASENETEEIAAGIGRAIILAQELREKLKLNVAASKKKSWRKDSIEHIYSSNLMLVNNRKKISKDNISTQKVNIARNSDAKETAQVKADKVTRNFAARKLTSPKLIDNAKQSDAIDKKIQNAKSKTSSTKIAAKLKREKNFILENKTHVKKISSANKLQAGRNTFNDDPQNSGKSLTPEASAAELNDLIRKIATRQSTENALIPSLNYKTDCPLHGSDAHQFIQERIATIDVVEALRYFNVPNDIVKVLRSYYAFLKTETDDSNDTKENRYEKSRDAFLKEFEAMNTITQDCLPQERHLLKTAAESISIFKIFNENLNSTQLNDIKNTLDQLRASLKQYNIKNIIESAIETPFCNFSLARGWMSNGIWNISCMGHFENFSRAYNIRYRNRKQLLSLYEAVQKLQRTEYLNTLIIIILRDLMPIVKSNIEPTSTEYTLAYKVMFILHQGLNPKVPVLVRTD
ncbi:hypothetical protein ACFW04_000744 [Cataglyphis niger]